MRKHAALFVKILNAERGRKSDLFESMRVMMIASSLDGRRKGNLSHPEGPRNDDPATTPRATSVDADTAAVSDDEYENY
jgi:hypothetical protein